MGTYGLCKYSSCISKTHSWILQHRSLWGDAKITTIKKQTTKKYNKYG
jgi:hypothetical protein